MPSHRVVVWRGGYEVTGITGEAEKTATLVTELESEYKRSKEPRTVNSRLMCLPPSPGPMSFSSMAARVTSQIFSNARHVICRLSIWSFLVLLPAYDPCLVSCALFRQKSNVFACFVSTKSSADGDDDERQWQKFIPTWQIC